MREKLARDLEAEQILEELVAAKGETPAPRVDKERRGARGNVVAKRTRGKLANEPDKYDSMGGGMDNDVPDGEGCGFLTG